MHASRGAHVHFRLSPQSRSNSLPCLPARSVGWLGVRWLDPGTTHTHASARTARASRSFLLLVVEAAGGTAHAHKSSGGQRGMFSAWVEAAAGGGAASQQHAEEEGVASAGSSGGGGQPAIDRPGALSPR